jgi:hypothetical protein
MATLTEVAYVSRGVIKFGGIILLVLMVGRVLGNGLIEYWREANPPELPPPTQGFGPLDTIIFPENDNPPLTYVLELPSGTFDTFNDRGTVYRMQPVRPNLIALERAKDDAKRLGFQSEPTILSDTLYQWKRQEPIPNTLEMKIYTGTFTYRVDWLNRVDFLTEKRFATEKDTIEKVKDYLQRANLMDADLDNGQVRITYLKAVAQEYREAVSLSEADFIQVDLYREKILDTYEVMPTDPDKGIVRGIVSGNKSVDITGIDYAYFPVNYSDYHSYWIKTPAEAFEELKAGGGYVASIKPEISTATVRRVSLGYYDSYQPQDFLQPVYIFRGEDDDLVAYVSAVTMIPREK